MFDSRRFTLSAVALALVVVLLGQCYAGPSEDDLARATAADVKDAKAAAARQAAGVRRELAKSAK